MQVWKVAARTERCRHVAEKSCVRCAAFAPDGRSLAVASVTSHRGEGADFPPIRKVPYDTTIQIWEVATARQRLQFRLEKEEVSELKFSPDCGTLASTTSNGGIQRWDLTTGQRLAAPAGPAAKDPRLQFTPCGRLLDWSKAAKSFHTRAPNLWDVMTGKRLTPEDGHPAVIDAVGFIEGGGTLVTADRQGLVLTWDVRTGKPQRPVEIDPDYAQSRALLHFQVRSEWQASPGFREIRRPKGADAPVAIVGVSGSKYG